MTNRGVFLAVTSIAMTALAACSAQQQANLQAAATVSCNAAAIAAAASVAITADVDADAQAQKDATTAQKVTSDTCSALAKLPSVAGASGTSQ